eukprot:Phypoly_transcript_10814.p1 GENE.Phypoly_transcript_10814~~Phypoly_transcript_10814.p1  ORF type:complete len:324 (+),score=24.19 Phypoly_transcript_10814:90-1061(+)
MAARHWVHFLVILCAFCCVSCLVTTIDSGVPWYDDQGNRIEAHGGGWTLVGSTYYWYGESQKTDDLTTHGVTCYSSIDLLNWHYEGMMLYQQNITHVSEPGPYIVERPHVVYNANTKLYVLWFHLDNAAYEMRQVGIATSPTPTGPFQFLGGFQPDGQQSLDMTVYQDTDGSAYLIRSVGNVFVGISKLSDDYLNTTGIISSISEQREGPAMFKFKDQYYLVTSHLSGWAPNPMELFMGGPVLDGAKWVSLGNPTNDATTFNSQSTNVLEYPYGNGQTLLIYQGDRWNDDGPGGLLNATYVWLPIIPNASNFTISWADSWKLP